MDSSVQRMNHICLLIITGIAITCLLYFSKSVLVPFVFSLVIYEAVLPLIHFLEKRCKMRSFFANVLGYFSFLLVFALILSFLIVSVDDFLRTSDAYKHALQEQVDNLILVLKDRALIEQQFELKDSLKDLPLFGFIKGFASNTAGIIGDISLIGLFVGFLMFGSEKGLPKNHFFSQVNQKISKYLNTKFICSVSTALLVALVLWLFGSDLILVFAVTTFVLNFIPNVGSVFATLIPIPFLVLKIGFGIKFAICVALIAAIQFIIGNIVEPKMMGESLNLHPIAILIFLLFWGLIWGIPGMFLAIPITASIKILLEKIEATKPLANLLEGKLT